MRAILIDPSTQTVSEVEIDRSHDAMRQAIGGYPERAGALSSGDTLFVDSNGFIMQGNRYFDIGSHQNYAGRGLITGATFLSSASISVDEVNKMVTYPDEPRLPKPRSQSFGSMDQLFDHISKTKGASDALPLAKRQDAEINLLPSLKHVDDGDFSLGRNGSAPHLEMFPKSGNTELIHIPLRFAYGITPEGIRWHVPSGMKAERLKSALKPGEPLMTALSRARMAALADAAIHAACTAVTDELDRLAVR